MSGRHGAAAVSKKRRWFNQVDPNAGVSKIQGRLKSCRAAADNESTLAH
jgi:hypothetical protein